MLKRVTVLLHRSVPLGEIPSVTSNKIVASLLAMLLVFSSLPLFAYAGEDTSETTLPAITYQPEDASVAAGEAVKFEINYTESGNTLVQWQESTDAYANDPSSENAWKDIESDINASAVTKTLMVKDVTAEQDGSQYRAVLKNEAGTVESDSASLTVTKSESENTDAEKMEASLGDDDSADIESRSDQSLTTISGDETTLSATSEPEYQTYTDPNDPTVTYTVPTQVIPGKNIVISGTGWKTTNGEAGSVFTVLIDARYSGDPETVHTTREVIDPLNGQILGDKRLHAKVQADKDGTWTVVFPCPSSETAYYGFEVGTPAIDWPVGSVHEIRFLSGSSINGDVIRTLTANFTVASDSGQEDQEAPSIISHPIDTTVEEGESATFTAFAVGTPDPAVQWQSRVDENAVWTDIQGATASTLVLSETMLSQNGTQYQAVFINAEGSVTSRLATLTVTSKGTVDPSTEIEIDLGDGIKWWVPATVIEGQEFTLRGVGWQNIAGTAGSVIAIKLDDGGVTTKETIINPATGGKIENNQVIAVVQADESGAWTVTVKVPTLDYSNAQWTAGEEHTIRLLTGTLAGEGVDAIRTSNASITVVSTSGEGEYKPVLDPEVLDPSEDLSATNKNNVSLTRSGNNTIVTIPSASEGDWVQLSAYLDGSVRYAWGVNTFFRVNADGEVEAPLASTGLSEAGTYQVVVRDMNKGADGAVIGWTEHTVVAAPKKTEIPVSNTVETTTVLRSNTAGGGSYSAGNSTPINASAPTTVPAAPVVSADLLTAANAGTIESSQEGSILTLFFPTLAPGDWVYLFTYSGTIEGADTAYPAPKGIGWLQLDAEGKLRLDIASLGAGKHKLAFVIEDGTLVGWSGVELAAEEAAESDTTVQAAEKTLSKTLDEHVETDNRLLNMLLVGSAGVLLIAAIAAAAIYRRRMAT